jgi:molybdate transport system ATP-binding protein
MVLLARALIGRPALLLLDEVFTGLDRENHDLLLRWLARLRGHLPVVLATHELADVPATATHALVLHHGHIVFRGTLKAAAAAHFGQMAHAARSGSRRRPGRAGTGPYQPLVRLDRAHVYLDGFHALYAVSMAVHPGEFWVIHGPNGSGKTTLLRTLYGDHGVAAGGIIERAGMAPGVPLEHFRERTGIAAPYIHASYPRNYTVAQVVRSGRHSSIGLQRPFASADREAARRALRRLGLSGWAQRTLAELSYGQARRVLFARALVRQPRLLLLDEPFDSVDAATRALLARELARQVARSVAIVITAHAVKEWSHCATHELELLGGQVRYAGVLRAAS